MTIEDRLLNLELQVGHLKRWNRWLLFATVVLSGVIALPFVLGIPGLRAGVQATEMPVTNAAREFRLEDENGRARAVLGMDKNGPRLKFLDERGSETAFLGRTGSGSGLFFSDAKGKDRVRIGMDESAAFLGLGDLKDQDRFVVTAAEEGTLLRLLDAFGQQRIALGVKEGAKGDVINVDESGMCGLMIDSEAGLPQATLLETTLGPALMLYDGLGNKSAVLVSALFEANLVFYNPKGQVVWTAKGNKGK